MEKIDSEVKKQEQERRNKIYQDNSTDAERTVYDKLKKILFHFRDNIFPEWFEEIKMKSLYSKEYEAWLKRHNMQYKSAKIYPLITSIHDTFMASLYDNDLRPKVFPMEEVDPQVVDDAQLFFQWWVEISETEQTNEIIRNEASLIWASYWMPWYTTSIMKDDEWENQVMFIPCLFPVSAFEMFYSIWATDFYKAPEKFRRRFMPFDQLKDAFYPIWDWKDWMGKQVEKKKSAILEAPMPLSKADFTKIYDIDAYSQTYLGYLWDWTPTGAVYDDTFNILDGSSYCEVVDLYIGDKLMVMVNGYFVYSGDSPFKYWEDFAISSKDGPFIELTFEKWVWCIPSWIGKKVMWHQKQCNALYNSLADAMYRHLNPVLAAVQWAITDPTTGNAPTTIWYDEGKVYSINPSYAGMNNAITKIDFTDYNILQLAMNHFENIKADAYTICWVNSYVLGWEWKIERSRYWAEQRVNASKARLSPMIKSIGRFYAKLFYHWLWLAKQSWASVAYVQTDDEEYVINLSELDKKFKIVCSADIWVEEAKASKVQWLLTMMQNTSAFAMNPITGLPDIDNKAFLESVADYAGLKGFKAMTTDEQKQYIDDSYIIKDYIQQKEIEAQQQAQQEMPQQQQQMAQPTNWQPTEEELAMMMQQAQWASPDQSQMPYVNSAYPTEQVDESQLDFVLPQ